MINGEKKSVSEPTVLRTSLLISSYAYTSNLSAIFL